MTIIEQLDKVLANVSKVYSAGVEEGKTSSSAGWKHVKTINLMDYCEFYYADSGDVETDYGIYGQFNADFWVGENVVPIFPASDPDKLIKVVSNTPQMSPYTYDTEEAPSEDIFTVWIGTYLNSGAYQEGDFYSQEHTCCYDRIPPLVNYIRHRQGYDTHVTGNVVCFCKLENDTYTIPTEWLVDVYELEGVEL